MHSGLKSLAECSAARSHFLAIEHPLSPLSGLEEIHFCVGDKAFDSSLQTFAKNSDVINELFDFFDRFNRVDRNLEL